MLSWNPKTCFALMVCLSVIFPNCGTDGSLMRKFGRQQVSHFPIIHFAPKRRSPYTIKSEGAKISRQFDMVWQNVAINSGSENLCAYTLYHYLLDRISVKTYFTPKRIKYTMGWNNFWNSILLLCLCVSLTLF